MNVSHLRVRKRSIKKKALFFFQRLKDYDLQDQAVLLSFDKESKGQNIESAVTYGKSLKEVKQLIEKADFLWNFYTSIRLPFLNMFRNRVLLDLDPGHLQVAALDCMMNIDEHHAYLTVGGKMDHVDCEVPLLSIKWKPFKPFVYLPLWNFSTNENLDKPFTSITHWNWNELDLDGRRLSLSKREAYMRYVDLPKRIDYPFELATYLEPDDNTGDKEFLQLNGWGVIDPWVVTNSPKLYQEYISNSRAEISCPKQIFRELNTGWFSDRSVCYLASGRPVLAEDTGFSDILPTGDGLLVFHDMHEAIAGVNEINNNYDYHMKAARGMAEELFSSDRCLREMLEMC